jgi:hypothetical protein
MKNPSAEGEHKATVSREKQESTPRQGRRPCDTDDRGLQVSTTKVALQLPSGMAYEQWEHVGRQLAGVLTSSSWWLGDWLFYGKSHYSDRYERGIHMAGLKYQTLRNYAWVAGRFPPARRRATLSFQHHAEIASMSADQQEQWLQRAQQNEWTLRQLRCALRDARDGGANSTADCAGVRRLAVPSERYRRWNEAAAQSGTEVDQWIMATLDNAARQILSS